jgi:hypothetical protein
MSRMIVIWSNVTVNGSPVGLMSDDVMMLITALTALTVGYCSYCPLPMPINAILRFYTEIELDFTIKIQLQHSLSKYILYHLHFV